MCLLLLHWLKLAATLETRLNRVSQPSARCVAAAVCFPAAGAHSQHHNSARCGQPIMTQHKTSGRWGRKGGRLAAAVM